MENHHDFCNIKSIKQIISEKILNILNLYFFLNIYQKVHIEQKKMTVVKFTAEWYKKYYEDKKNISQITREQIFEFMKLYKINTNDK